MSIKKNRHFPRTKMVALVQVTTALVLLLCTSSLCQSRSCVSISHRYNPFYRARTSPSDPIYFEGCGKAKPIDFQVESPSRLKGSIRVKDGQFPYYVRLANDRSRPENWVFCSGLLISDQHVLTAGHCAYMYTTGGKEILFAGGLSISANTTCRSAKYTLWDADEYGVTGAYYDLALIKMDRPVQFSNLIQPICLPQKPIPPGLQLFSSGKETYENSSREKPGIVPSLQVKCTGKNIHESVLCARPNKVDKMQSACRGDSGSPLAGFVDGKWTVFGIASYGRIENCKYHDNTVTYYVDVYNMMDELKMLFAECG